MNKVVLIGRLSRDPELRQTAGGIANCQFNLAVSKNFRNKDGVVEADFISIVAWRRTAEIIANYCKKGTQIAVEGRIQTRSYDAQDGTKRYITEVLADNIELLGSRSSNTGSNGFVDAPNNFDYSDMPAVAETDIPKEDPFKDFGNEVSLSDDDLPF